MSYHPSTSYLCGCGQPDSYDNLIQCEECIKWYHMKCQGITQVEADLVEKFLCHSCKSDDSSSHSETVSSDTSSSDDENIPDGEFEVDKILGHKIMDGKIIYNVRWKGYGPEEDSYLSAKELVNAHLMVEKYRLEHGITIGTVYKPSKVGFLSSSSARGDLYSEENWIDIDTILKCINTYSSRRSYTRIINVELFDTIKTRDHIYVVQFVTHAIVALCQYDERICYLCDGSNQVITSKRVQSHLLQLFPNFDLKFIRFDHQRNVDHCGSSAVLIALEFMRLYGSSSQIPHTLTVERSVQERLVSTFHKERSTKLGSWIPIKNNLPVNSCTKCGKTFKSRDRRPLVTHMRNCAV